MENVGNLSQNCSLYCSKSRQKFTVYWKQVVQKIHTFILSRLSFSFFSIKHIMPMVSIVFLVLIAASSIIKVNTKYAQQEQMIHQTTLLLTGSIESLFKNSSVQFKPESKKKAESILNDFLLNIQPFSKDFILLAESNGLVFASSTDNSPYIGKKISDIIPGLYPLTSMSKNAQTSEVFLSQEPYHVSSILLPNNDGLVLVANSKLPLLHFWRTEVTLEVIFFASISAILLFLLCSYYQQIKSTEENDTSLLEANTCVEEALSRGRCGIWDFNLASKKFHLSQSMCEILGIPATHKTLSFRAIARLVHFDGKEIYDIARSITKGHSTQLDKIFRVHYSTGTDIWIKVRAQVMNTLSGGMNVIGIAMDVTEQYYLEKRYAEVDQRLSKAIECTSEAFVLWDKNDRLVMCNAKYQQVYGLPDHVLIPGTKRSIINEAQINPVVEYYTSDPKRLQNISKEIKLVDSRWLQVNEWHTHDAGTISVGTDITQLKRNQKKLRESERRLKATINDLSTSRQILERQKTELSIANAKYQTEKERAEMANRAKSEFLAKMSHELRTPLNAILGFSEIIKGETFGKLGSVKYYEYAKDIHDSGKHLLNLINNILEMSKIESEHIAINKKNTNLIPIINESLQLIAPSAKKKNIMIEKNISPELFCNADERIIKKILIPIFSNSIKFTNNGGKMIVQTSRVNDSVIITVSDTGIGIPKSALKKVGKPFEQLHNQYDQNTGGSGLGLAISDALTNLHGGKLEILSQEGEGTVIKIGMPK
ncbi:PAS domain-containing sensor histidine kinase [Candidatus Liberibacter solanacearum]|uniref:histidine kinase n=2 Tax=Candidatus Liberibacter solanacearum TaxID=556287 RepID=A0A3R7QMF3_9HYPH|nr:PAS domain-containing sensor histidine kinase [Candidatus Liberibacter solanacearum]